MAGCRGCSSHARQECRVLESKDGSNRNGLVHLRSLEKMELSVTQMQDATQARNFST
jgi:hypothetical protein